MEKTAMDDKHLDAITGNMSEVNPDIIQQEPPKSPNKMPSPAPEFVNNGAKDRQGRSFDPSLHEVDATGNPRLNRDGFLACKPGRPGKTGRIRSQESSQVPPPGSAQPSPNITEDIKRQNTAKISAGLFIQIGVGFFGEEWLPQKMQGIDERENLVILFDDYYRSKGLSDIPPGAALALGLCGYAVARLHLPTTRSRFQILAGHAKRFIGKIFRGFFGLFKKFKGVKINASHVDSRHDGERKDNARPEAGKEIQEPGNSGSGT